MKRSIIFLTLAFTGTIGLAQETKPVVKRTDGVVEEYSVLVSDKTTRQGKYLKLREHLFGLFVLELGSYDKGQKHGAWEFYYEPSIWAQRRNIHKLKEKGFFVYGRKNGIWSGYHLDTIRSDTYAEPLGKKRNPDSLRLTISHNDLRIKWIGQYLNDKRIGEWTWFDYKGNIIQKYNFSKKKLLLDVTVKDSSRYNTTRKPLYPGGSAPLFEFLFSELRFGQIVSLKSTDTLSVKLELKISPEGKLVNIAAFERRAPVKFEKELIRIASLIDESWLPGLRDGKPVESSYVIQFFVLSTVSSGRSYSYKSWIEEEEDSY